MMTMSALRISRGRSDVRMRMIIIPSLSLDTAYAGGILKATGSIALNCHGIATRRLACDAVAPSASRCQHGLRGHGCNNDSDYGDRDARAHCDLLTPLTNRQLMDHPPSRRKRTVWLSVSEGVCAHTQSLRFFAHDHDGSSGTGASRANIRLDVVTRRIF